jgi:hypothetical protein
MKRSSSMTRRAALGGIGGALAGSSLLDAQQEPFRDHSRVPAMDELTSVMEFEAIAFAKMQGDPSSTWRTAAKAIHAAAQSRSYDWWNWFRKASSM